MCTIMDAPRACLSVLLLNNALRMMYTHLLEKKINNGFNSDTLQPVSLERQVILLSPWVLSSSELWLVRLVFFECCSFHSEKTKFSSHELRSRIKIPSTFWRTMFVHGCNIKAKIFQKYVIVQWKLNRMSTKKKCHPSCRHSLVFILPRVARRREQASCGNIRV